MNKEIKKILLVLALFSLGGSFLYSYQEMWLLSNSLSVGTISTIFALAAVLTISVLYICSSLVRKEKLKVFIKGLLLAKVVTSLLLFLLNKSGYSVPIKFITLVEYVIDVEIFVSIYPLIAIINKNDKIYALKDIIYDGCYYLGALICALLLKYGLLNINFNYNSYLPISCLLYILAFIVLSTLDINKYSTKNQKEENISYGKLLKVIKKDKISKYYLGFTLTGNISFYSLSGTVMILLTEGLKVPTTTSSLLLIAFGITSVTLGYVTLKKLAFKNDYINLGIKYIVRTILYLIAFVINKKIFLLLAIIYCKITADSFGYISDGPYINRIESDMQFSFANLRSSIGYLGRAIGTLLCGTLVVIDARLNFLSALIFALLQLTFMFLAKNDLTKEQTK